MNVHAITGKQLKDARKALGLSNSKLAERAGISRVSVRVYEACGPGEPNGYSHVITRLVRYLQAEGIEFLDDGTVRLQRPAAAPAVHSEAVV
jgi:predicted transcriptional regulator